MMRMPTRLSDGRANLHQGAVGVGIDLVSGVRDPRDASRASHREEPRHGRADRRPACCRSFDVVLRTAVAATDQTGLGYVGADVVLDAKLGPVILELNARPGLAIQLANRAGLLPRLDAVDARLGPQDAAPRRADARGAHRARAQHRARGCRDEAARAALRRARGALAARGPARRAGRRRRRCPTIVTFEARWCRPSASRAPGCAWGRTRCDRMSSASIPSGTRTCAPTASSWSRAGAPPGSRRARGGSLRYDFRIDKLRNASAYDARISEQWAIFRGDDLFPPARVQGEGRRDLALDAAPARARGLVDRGALRAPRGRPLSHRERAPALRPPHGWMALGRIGVLREKIAGSSVAVAGPFRQKLRRQDILALLRWTLPQPAERARRAAGAAARGGRRRPDVARRPVRPGLGVHPRRAAADHARRHEPDPARAVPRRHRRALDRGRRLGHRGPGRALLRRAAVRSRTISKPRYERVLAEHRRARRRARSCSATARRAPRPRAP